VPEVLGFTPVIIDGQSDVELPEPELIRFTSSIGADSRVRRQRDTCEATDTAGLERAEAQTANAKRIVSTPAGQGAMSTPRSLAAIMRRVMSLDEGMTEELRARFAELSYVAEMDAEKEEGAETETADTVAAPEPRCTTRRAASNRRRLTGGR
jgi:hypothetical protein